LRRRAAARRWPARKIGGRETGRLRVSDHPLALREMSPARRHEEDREQHSSNEVTAPTPALIIPSQPPLRSPRETHPTSSGVQAAPPEQQWTEAGGREPTYLATGSSRLSPVAYHQAPIDDRTRPWNPEVKRPSRKARSTSAVRPPSAESRDSDRIEHSITVGRWRLRFLLPCGQNHRGDPSARA
jgi:hypothetical protein